MSCAHLLDINAAGEQIGGDQDTGGAGAELAHDDIACVLVHVAVGGADGEVALLHGLGEPVDLPCSCVSACEGSQRQPGDCRRGTSVAAVSHGEGSCGERRAVLQEQQQLRMGLHAPNEKVPGTAIQRMPRLAQQACCSSCSQSLPALQGCGRG